ncbi:hypothetical protein O181_074430 [Austropuccinia psidii MF-1]|uniref:Uncharacterized protein n=1 Tax=Austropuccinia psidii MF-1 TaxID=1389203 RepID=A0A9Q3ICZ8_9BASI|nr:hypothetical protein [Austropuccinia psidii MF-1]
MLRRGIEAQRLLGAHMKVLELIEEKEEPTNERGNLIKVGKEVYGAMVEMIERHGRGVQRFQDFPHPQGSWILSQFAKAVQLVAFGDEMSKVCPLPPNNVVVYKDQVAYRYGLVKGLYILHGKQNEPLTGVYLSKITPQYTQLKYPPGHIGYYLSLLGVFDESKFLMIQPCDIVLLADYRLL